MLVCINEKCMLFVLRYLSGVEGDRGGQNLCVKDYKETIIIEVAFSMN